MIGAPVFHYETVTSTNDAAKQLASDGEPEGTVVVADEQTKGRGSRGRDWLSPRGANLYASFILRPDIPPARYGELAFVAAVALVRTMKSTFGLDALVKWPNDVLVNGRKIAGILVEVSKDAAIIGIGVNVNWTRLPAAIAATATSIKNELDKTAELEDVLKALCRDLDVAYRTHKVFGFEQTLQDWMSHQETIGKIVTVERNGESLTGYALGVDSHGALMLKMSDGGVRTVSAGIVVDKG